jgi:hypothetical protein
MGIGQGQKNYPIIPCTNPVKIPGMCKAEGFEQNGIVSGIFHDKNAGIKTTTLIPIRVNLVKIILTRKSGVAKHMPQEIKYDGDVLTDTTSFSMVQNIFDGKKEITKSQIESLDSIIQLLVFYDNIWIIKPALFGADIQTESQEIFNTLIQSKVVNRLPEIPSGEEADPETQLHEINEIINPVSIEKYYELHPGITHDLQIYNQNFDVSKNVKAVEFAKNAHLDKKYLPLCANLLRSNYYLKHVQQIKQKEGKIITYSPNILRTSLVKDIVNHRDNNIHQILHDQITSIESPEKEKRKYLAERAHCNFDLELPLLTAIIVDECKKKDDFLEQILTWRKDPSAIKVRGWMKQFQSDICNKRLENVGKHFDKLDNFSKSIGAKSSTKANLVSCLTDQTLIQGGADTIINANPAPLAAGAIHSLGKNIMRPLLNSYFNRDLFLFMKMKEKGEKISFEKDKFEEIFDVTIRL